MDYLFIGGGLRVSPHFYNTEAELVTLFETIGQIQGQ
jgi:selenocysteine lyase/cysteine desulfurase